MKFPPRFALSHILLAPRSNNSKAESKLSHTSNLSKAPNLTKAGAGKSRNSLTRGKGRIKTQSITDYDAIHVRIGTLQL